MLSALDLCVRQKHKESSVLSIMTVPLDINLEVLQRRTLLNACARCKCSPVDSLFWLQLSQPARSDDGELHFSPFLISFFSTSNILLFNQISPGVLWLKCPSSADHCVRVSTAVAIVTHPEMSFSQISTLVSMVPISRWLPRIVLFLLCDSCSTLSKLKRLMERGRKSLMRYSSLFPSSSPLLLFTPLIL